MTILYRGLEFAYIWTDKEFVYESTGSIGIEGKIVVSDKEENNNEETKRQFYISKQFEQKKTEDLDSVTVFIKKRGMDLDNLSFRYLVEDELRILLIKTGNGFSEGGEIGRDGLRVFLYVKNSDIFLKQCDNYMKNKGILDFEIEIDENE